MMSSKIIKYKRHRVHHPFHDLLSAAYSGLSIAQNGEYCVPQNTLIAIVFSALAIEGLANGFGSALVLNWEKFDRSSTVKKIRVLLNYIEKVDLISDEEWEQLNELFTFRNQIVHPRHEEFIETGEDNLINYDRISHIGPKSKLDKQITIHKAKLYVDLAHKLHHRLSEYLLSTEKLDRNNAEYNHKYAYLLGDGWFGEGEIV